MTNVNLPLWKHEFFDLHDILEMGAKKYCPDGWLQIDGARASFKEYHDSAFHHLAQSYAAGREGEGRLDTESNYDHLLHCAVNCLMAYTRLKRNIKHPKD